MFQIKVTYLVCLAHTSPIDTLKELWNMHKIRNGLVHGNVPVLISGDDLARILCIVIQGNYCDLLRRVALLGMF
jgi:hypothetical protein